MQTLEIQVPDNKLDLIKDFLKELEVNFKIDTDTSGIKITLTIKTVKKTEANSLIPNADTLKAMNELKAGKGKRFGSVEELFNSI